MDVRLSAEQEALRDSVVRVAERYGPTAVGQLDDEARLDAVESAVVDAGWRELRASDGGDGPLASGVEVAIVAEALGRRLVEVPVPRADARRGAPSPRRRTRRRRRRDDRAHRRPRGHRPGHRRVGP